jgi:predicted transcriptional regulator of viral defense system
MVAPMTDEGSGRIKLGRTEREVLTLLAALDRPSFGVSHVMAAHPSSRAAANLLLSRLARKGRLRRLRRGAYGVVPLSPGAEEPPPEDPFAVAMQLFTPCYVSGWSAAEHWGLTPYHCEPVTVYSARPQRRGMRQVAGVRYRIRRVPPDHIFGTTRVQAAPVPVDMADIHRTVIDVLDAPEMGGGGSHVLDIVEAYWGRPDADPQVLLQYASRLGRGTVFKRLGMAAELTGRADEEWLLLCRDLMSAGVSLFDPAREVSGPIVSRWRLRLNVPLEPFDEAGDGADGAASAVDGAAEPAGDPEGL